MRLTGELLGDDHQIMVLTEAVSDTYLSQLRHAGISYLFAGAVEIDLEQALRQLSEAFGIRRILLEGGGTINRAFLEKQLIDEISLLVAPVADGSQGAPTVFDRATPSGVALHLISVEQLPEHILHLRFSMRQSVAVRN